MDQHTTNRTDDADARGEHEYKTTRSKGAGQPLDSGVHREPNTYAAGEHGTQQVTAQTPGSSAGAEDKADPLTGKT